MADEAAIVDPIQAGCAAGRRARDEDAAAGLEPPPARPLLLMRGAIACAALVDRLPGPPLHDAAIARERFVWAFILGYTEGTGHSSPGISGAAPGSRRRWTGRMRPAAPARLAASGSGRRRARRRFASSRRPFPPRPSALG